MWAAFILLFPFGDLIVKTSFLKVAMFKMLSDILVLSLKMQPFDHYEVSPKESNIRHC